jgi:hypothetical protein
MNRGVYNSGTEIVDDIDEIFNKMIEE